jgi:hypothetical protein
MTSVVQSAIARSAHVRSFMGKGSLPRRVKSNGGLVGTRLVKICRNPMGVGQVRFGDL